MIGFIKFYNTVIDGVRHLLFRNTNNNNSIYSINVLLYDTQFTVTKLNWLVLKIISSLEIQNKLISMLNN